MNGWWRVGVVVATLIAIPSGLAGWGESAYSTLYPATLSDATMAMPVGPKRDEAIKADNANAHDLRNCQRDTITVEEVSNFSEYTIRCNNGIAFAATQALEMALIPFVALLILGHTIAWVHRGFRPQK